jgi:glycosyltransferase involved in cell wall biosynthesis
MSLWIDVTTSVSAPPPAVGISRVESNLVEHLCTAAPEVSLCFYENGLGRFSEITLGEFMRVRQAPPPANPREPIRVQVERPDQSPNGGIEIFDRGDVLICCGIQWRPEFANMDRLYAIRSAIGLRLVMTCYDLIPITHRHLVPGMDIVFEPYLKGMVRHSDHILCISRCTRRDLLRWIDAIGERIPDTSVVPLGCELRARSGVAPRDDVARLLGNRYLLFVSTIEHRKNQQTLCRAYARLVDWGVTDLPTLVFAGAIGIGGAALVEEIAADHRLRGKVVALSGTSDADLVALYRGCLFTVYPSLYEGWGMPVSESLAYGKLCLASREGSLPEAGEEFVDYLDPWDVDEWANRIYRYISIPGAVARREDEIRRYFRPRRWRDAVAHVLDVVARLP